MRILINAVSAVTGGGMTYLVNLLKYLPDLMPESEFLAVIQGITLPEEIYNKPNLSIRLISDEIGSTNLIKRYWWENSGMIKLAKNWKADLIYCIANIAPIVPTGLPIYTMLQNVAPITKKVLRTVYKSEGLKPFLKMLANTYLTLFSTIISRKTLVLSDSSEKLLKEWIPFCKTVKVHHGISDIFKPDLERPEKAGNEPYFIFVSNIYVYKGLEYIIEAYKTNPELPHIFIVGKAFDINYMKYLNNQITENKLENKIIFLQSLPYTDLPNWYANAIANVFPSWCESFGCGIIEAQACGCPIVGMKVATLPEYCYEKDLLADTLDGHALAECMKKAIELRKNPSLVKELVDFSKYFTWENAMEIHKKIFSN